jgi:uncharacterized protein
VKVFVNQVPFEGITLEEDIAASELDLETEIIKFHGSVRIKANVSRITNAVSAQVTISTVIYSNCSRCLDEIKMDFKKEISLNYPVDKAMQVIDFNPDIREEILLDYPMKPLCNPNCKGLCPKCGNKLSEGGCTCGST